MLLNTLVNEVVYIPRSQRVCIDLEVRCRVHGGRAKVVLKNLTPEGARIEALEGLRYDDVITLSLPSLKPKTAIVVWVKGDCAGLAFERPLHPDIFADLVRKHGDTRPRISTDATPATVLPQERRALPQYLAA
jgi:hypothetical protein